MSFKPKPWLYFRAFANNKPDYFIVTNKAFKGAVCATCDLEANAELICKAINEHFAREYP